MNDEHWLLKRGFLAASAGPFLVGLLEGLVVGVNPIFSAAFYMTAAAIVSFLPLFLVTLLRPPKITLATADFLLRLVAVLAFSLPTLVIGRFLIFRNYYGEHQTMGGRSWLLAFLLTFLAALMLNFFIKHYQELGCYRLKRLANCFPLVAMIMLLGWFPTSGTASGKDNNNMQVTPKTEGTILIVADTLRADVLSFYSSKAPHGLEQRSIPNLQKMAQNGLIFDKLLANASWTKPAVASLMTAKLARQHQAMSKAALLSSEHETMAELFKAHGYQTLAIANNSNLSATFGFDQGFDIYHYLDTAHYLGLPASAAKLSGYNMLRLLWERFGFLPRRVENFYQPAAVVSQAALSLLKERRDGRPFFLYLHYMDLHDPYFAKDGRSFARVALPHPELSQAQELLGAYLDELERLDNGLGILFTGLEKMGLKDRVRVIFTADHGEEFADHQGFYHGTTLYNEQLHIPLVISGDEIPRGRFEGLARQIDILPTVAAWHNFDANSDWAGQDLLAGVTPKVHLAEEDHQGNQLKAIITEEYSLLLANRGNPRGLKQIELYNQGTDFPQHYDLAEGNMAKVEELSALEDQFGKSGDRVEEKAISPEVEAQLRALGYVE